jgi:hypothetical protein
MTLFQLNNPSVKRLTSIYTNTICLLLLPFFSKSLCSSASVGLWGKATENVAPGASCTLTPEGLPPYDKGHTTAKAAR